MMRSNRVSAATAARESHAAHTPCEHSNWHSHGVRDARDLRAAAATDGRPDRIIAHGFKSRAQ
eukprot:11213293-Lingulodinium_polyedra.AAC.1